MNQLNLPLAELSQTNRIAPLHRSQRAPAHDSLLVVRFSQLRNDEAASRIRSALPGSSIVSIFPVRDATSPCESESRLQSANSGRDALTGRQHDVLNLLVNGLSNKEIARQLRLSHFTVRNHVSNILRLLDFHCRRDMRDAFRDAGNEASPFPVPAKQP